MPCVRRKTIASPTFFMKNYIDSLKQPGATSGTKRVSLAEIPHGKTLKVGYFGGYREVSGEPQSASASKYINLGYSLRGHDFFLASEDTAVTRMVITVNGIVYLPEGSIPFAVFEATTSSEDSVVIISGQLI